MPLRKKQSQSLIDQASDALVAARPVIENAVATVVEGARDLSKDAAAGATVMAKETKTKAAPLIADGKVLAGEIADATREVAIPKAKTAAAAGAASAVGLAASGKEYAAAKVADVKGEPPKRKGSKFRKLLFWGTLAAAAGFVYQKLRPKPETDNWQSSYTPPASAGSTSSTTSATTGTRRPPVARTSPPASAPTSRSRPTTRWPGWRPRAPPVTTRVAPTPPRPSPTRSRSPTTSPPPTTRLTSSRSRTRAPRRSSRTSRATCVTDGRRACRLSSEQRV